MPTNTTTPIRTAGPCAAYIRGVRPAPRRRRHRRPRPPPPPAGAGARRWWWGSVWGWPAWAGGARGWYGWEMYGTTYVAERRHGSVVEQLEREWDARAGGDTVRDTGDGGRRGGGGRHPRRGGRRGPRRRRDPDPALRRRLRRAGARGRRATTCSRPATGHFTDSADPVGGRNYAVAAHRVTHGEPLRDMPELQPGDDVVVETADTVYTYRLTSGGDDLVVGFEDYWVRRPAAHQPRRGRAAVQEPGAAADLADHLRVGVRDRRADDRVRELVDASPRRTTG